MDEKLGPVLYSVPQLSKLRLSLQLVMLTILAVMLVAVVFALTIMVFTGDGKPQALLIVGAVGAGATASFYLAYTKLMVVLSPAMPVLAVHDKGLALSPKRPHRTVSAPDMWLWGDFDRMVARGMSVRDVQDGLKKRLVYDVTLTTRSGDTVTLPDLPTGSRIPEVIEKRVGDALLRDYMERYHQGRKLRFGNIALDKRGILGIPWVAFTGEYSHVYFAQNPGGKDFRKQKGVERIILYYRGQQGQRQDFEIPANMPNLYVFIKVIEYGMHRRFPLLYYDGG